MKYLIIALTTTLFIDGLLAYPISPVPLRELVKESDVITIVSVLKNEQVQGEEFSSTKAHLKVIKVLQGELDQTTLFVFYSRGMICPAPPYYPDGETVLVFLNKREDGKGYYTNALSYGTKVLNSKGLVEYEKRIVEMQSILRIENKYERQQKVLEWLVKCAEHVATRWEGLYELTPSSDFMSYYDQNETERQYSFLSKEQKERLLDALFVIDTLRYNDLGLVDIAIEELHPDVLPFLVRQLKQMNDAPVWYAAFIMVRIVAISSNEILQSIYKEYKTIDYREENREENEKKLIQKFVEAL